MEKKIRIRDLNWLVRMAVIKVLLEIALFIVGAIYIIFIMVVG